MGGVRNAGSCRAVLEAIVAAAAAPGAGDADRRAMAAEATAVFRAALAAPGPAVDATCFRQVLTRTCPPARPPAYTPHQ